MKALRIASESLKSVLKGSSAHMNTDMFAGAPPFSVLEEWILSSFSLTSPRQIKHLTTLQSFIVRKLLIVLFTNPHY